MNSFVIKKTINYDNFNNYLKQIKNNQYSNYGELTKQLEERARTMLRIHEDKAIIATCSGSAALNAIILAIASKHNKIIMPVVQDFTFPCNFQGEAKYARVTDIDENQQMVLPTTLQDNMVIATNCFGHLQNLDKLEQERKNRFLVYDNAATPYSFYNNSNACNYGVASFVSLHHTKHIGFGEGGLVIIDKEYEPFVREVISFGAPGSRLGGNFKISEIGAAAILQWWDQFDIDKMKTKLNVNYYFKKYAYLTYKSFTNYGDSIFPSCFPAISDKPAAAEHFRNEDMRKYYKPLKGFKESSKLYDNIACLPITEGLDYA